MELHVCLKCYENVVAVHKELNTISCKLFSSRQKWILWWTADTSRTHRHRMVEKYSFNSSYTPYHFSSWYFTSHDGSSSNRSSLQVRFSHCCQSLQLQNIIFLQIESQYYIYRIYLNIKYQCDEWSLTGSRTFCSS